jgi:pseudouridine synthase
MIAAGRVGVNGMTVRKMGTRMEEGIDIVAVDGRAVAPAAEKRYILYNKPAGEVTAVTDDRGRTTVLDRFAGFSTRLFPVGRLDYDSEGLLLLTNDGELTHRLLHPAREVKKEYWACVAGDVSEEEASKLRAGVYIEGEERLTAPAKVRVLARSPSVSTVLLAIHEGRNRQVRRMFGAVGHKVTALRRVRFGPLTLGKLRCGEYRELTSGEVKALQRLR